MKYALTVKQSLLFADLSFIGSGKEYFKKTLGIDYGFSECLIRGDDMFWNYDNDLLYNRAFLKKKTLNQAVKDFIISLEKVSNDLEQTTEKIATQKVENNNLQSTFMLYTEAYLLNMPFLFLFWNTENLLMNQLKLDFTFLFGKEKSISNLQQILVPSRPTFFSRERQSFEKIAQFYSKNPTASQKLQRMLAAHITRFSFTSFALQVGKPLDAPIMMKRLKELVQNKEKVAEHSISREQERTKRLLKRIALFPEMYERIFLAQELVFWKNQRLDILFKSDLRIKPLYEAIASSMQLSYEEFVYLRYREISNWFTTKKLPSKSVIQKRMKNYSLYAHKGRVKLFINKKKYPIIATGSDDGRMQPIKEGIQGTTAYPGKVRGSVRIIKTIEDLQQLQIGEILVTSMTRPEMIVGLEKAAAFVTDQGGMLSHAAIVAREMKKPCIVGTGNATAVLQDGERVEVDADTGFVKILEALEKR